jgi:hypothetical protein
MCGASMDPIVRVGETMGGGADSNSPTIMITRGYPPLCYNRGDGSQDSRRIPIEYAECQA